MISRGTFPLDRASDVERTVLTAELKIAETVSAISDADAEMEAFQITASETARDRWDELVNREQNLIEKITDLKRKIEASQRLLANAVVRAPHDGVLRNGRFALTGTTVASGEHLLDVAKPEQTFLVEAVAGAGEVAAITAGAGDKIRIASAAGEKAVTTIPALVEGLEAHDDGPDAAGGTRKLYLTVEERDVPGTPPQKLRTGYMVSIELDHSPARAVHEVPAAAIGGAPHPRGAAGTPSPPDSS